MTTTNTASLNMSIDKSIDEAFDRNLTECRSRYDFKTVRRSLNLLTMEWAWKGINLWTIEQGSIP